MSFIFSDTFSHLFFTGALSSSPKKSRRHFSAFSGHPVPLLVDVPVDDADDTIVTTLAVFDGGMSKKNNKQIKSEWVFK